MLATPSLRNTATTEYSEQAMRLILDPVHGSHANNHRVIGVVTIHVDDTFIAGTKTLTQTLERKLDRDVHVVSKDWNDIMFVGQRMKWVTENGKKARIEVDQDLRIEELTEIEFDPSLRDDIACTPDQHTQYRRVLWAN